MQVFESETVFHGRLGVVDVGRTKWPVWEKERVTKHLYTLDIHQSDKVLSTERSTILV